MGARRAVILIPAERLGRRRVGNAGGKGGMDRVAEPLHRDRVDGPRMSADEGDHERLIPGEEIATQSVGQPHGRSR